MAGRSHYAKCRGNDQSEATQSNFFNIAQGVISVVFVCIVCEAYCLGLMMVNRVSVALAPIPLIIIVYALYLVLYTIEKYGFATVATLECTLAFTL